MGSVLPNEQKAARTRNQVHGYLGMGLNNYFKVNIVGRNVIKWVIEAIQLSI